MGSHPLNLFFRFALEIVALVSTGIWGWNQSQGLPKYLLAIGIPIILAIIWGTFAVPDDPSRSGNAPIVINGILRLILELGIFTFGCWAVLDLGYTKAAVIFAVLVLIHYGLSYERVYWLIRK